MAHAGLTCRRSGELSRRPQLCFMHLRAALPLGGSNPNEVAPRRGEAVDIADEINARRGGSNTHSLSCAFPACPTETRNETAGAVVCSGTAVRRVRGKWLQAVRIYMRRRMSCEERAQFPDGAKSGSEEACVDEPPPRSHPETILVPPEWKFPDWPSSRWEPISPCMWPTEQKSLTIDEFRFLKSFLQHSPSV